MKRNNLLAGIVGVVIIVGIAGVVVWTMKSSDASTASATIDQSSVNPKPVASATLNDAAKDATASVKINFTGNGFSPNTYTVKAGQTVEVKNNSKSLDLQFSSGPHPIHNAEPELNLDIMAPGQTGTITPTRPGSWQFHDHIHDEFTGTLNVTK